MNPSTARPGARFFLLLRARWGKFTHSLARPRLCVVGTEGAFFLFAPCAAGQAKKKTRGAFFFVRHAAGRAKKKTFFLERAEQKKKHPRLCVVGTEGAFFVCSVRGGGNSLPHWRVCGCVWLKKRARFFFAPCAARGNSLTHWRIRGRVFFFVLCAAGEIHSLTGASTAVCGFFLLFARRGKFTHSLARPGALFFLFAACAAVDIHSLTGASGGDSLTHWRVRGRVFFFAPCAVGEIHSLTGASAAVCGWNRGRVFFVCSVRGGPSKKKTRGAFFFVRHAAGRAKKNFFSRARRAKKKTSAAVCGWNRGRVFCLLRARRGKFTPSLARLRLRVVEKAGAFFFLLRARQGEIHSLTGASGGAFFFLFCARRGKFTHSLARPRLCVVFFCCLRGGGNSLTHSRVRGRFFFVCCVRGGGHSLTHWRVRG